jgi:hypothetical protein
MDEEFKIILGRPGDVAVYKEIIQSHKEIIKQREINET